MTLAGRNQLYTGK